jgi:aspartate kinase
MIVAENSDFDSEKIITGIAGKKGFSAITIEKDMMNSEIGYGRKVLEVFEDNEISFEHLPSGIDNMSIVVSTASLEGRQDKILNAITRNVKADSVTIEDDLALIAIVGRGMVKAKGTAARVFDAISSADVNIRMIDQGSSELSIIVGIEERDFEKAHSAIYHEFVK